MRQDFLDTLNSLELSLRQLYQCIGYSSGRVKPLPDDLLIKIKSIVNSGKIQQYVLSLDRQVGDAVCYLKGHQVSPANDDIRIGKEILTGDNQNTSEKNVIKTAPDDDALLPLIRGLISVCDNLLVKRYYLIDSDEEMGGNAMRVVDSVLKEAENLLQKNGVEIINYSGKFSDAEQFAAKTCETEDDTLVGCVAEIIRPGYKYHDTVLRAEEVVVYTKKE